VFLGGLPALTSSAELSRHRIAHLVLLWPGFAAVAGSAGAPAASAAPVAKMDRPGGDVLHAVLSDGALATAAASAAAAGTACRLAPDAGAAAAAVAAARAAGADRVAIVGGAGAEGDAAVAAVTWLARHRRLDWHQALVLAGRRRLALHLQVGRERPAFGRLWRCRTRCGLQVGRPAVDLRNDCFVRGRVGAGPSKRMCAARHVIVHTAVVTGGCPGRGIAGLVDAMRAEVWFPYRRNTWEGCQPGLRRGGNMGCGASG
jgi:hypothetical protein